MGHPPILSGFLGNGGELALHPYCKFLIITAVVFIYLPSLRIDEKVSASIGKTTNLIELNKYNDYQKFSHSN